MIPKLFEVSGITVQLQGPAKEIEPLKEILQTLVSMKQYLDSDLDCILYYESMARDYQSPLII
tara:strand:- start:110 stop:298 length:189 start_codon:yes stop_codon:yes gene_type:complete